MHTPTNVPATATSDNSLITVRMTISHLTNLTITLIPTRKTLGSIIFAEAEVGHFLVEGEVDVGVNIRITANMVEVTVPTAPTCSKGIVTAVV